MENGCLLSHGSQKGFTVSLEAGYSWKAGEFTDNYKGSHEWYVQPQLQVVRMNVKSDKYHESNGTSIENTGNGNILTRPGARTWLTSKNGKKYAVCGSVQTICGGTLVAQ
ncbi:autotransporter outer membrane beta-barrel domain-containing protein [Escherichia coli]